jgi:DNA-directed RNA polymerase subunit omega
MNIELFKQALAKVGNPNVMVNLVSKRVRQLNSSGSISRPLVEETSNISAVDTALREILEDKITFEMPLTTELLVGGGVKKRRKA